MHAHANVWYINGHRAAIHIGRRAGLWSEQAENGFAVILIKCDSVSGFLTNEGMHCLGLI